MIHTDEDDEFDRIAHEAKMKGQPYYFEEHPTDPEKLIFRKPSRKFDDDDIQEYVRPWVGLTNEERSKIWGELPQTLNEERDACVFAEAIELYLKEKNT
jgi:hypothetical protein